MSQRMSLDARLGLDKYEIDETSHITVDQDYCRICRPRPCLTVCPAEVYTLAGDRIAVSYENCLECGTCQIACDGGGERGIRWVPPQGGFGVVFRYG